MTQLDIPTAAGRLAELVAAAAAGEEVIIAEAGRPVARLVAAGPGLSPPRVVEKPADWTDEQFAAARARGYGSLAGMVVESDDCWAPATDDELREWGLL